MHADWQPAPTLRTSDATVVIVPNEGPYATLVIIHAKGLSRYPCPPSEVQRLLSMSHEVASQFICDQLRGTHLR